MRINNVSPRTNFGKVIEIEKDSRDEQHEWGRFEAERTITDILNGGKKTYRIAERYSEKEEQQIREFFKPLLGKDNKNVLFRYYDKRKYLITGQESKDILAIEKFAEDMGKIKYPETKYENRVGTYNDGDVQGRINDFATTMYRATKDKCESLTRVYVHQDPNPIKLKLDYGNSCNKIEIIEATTKNENGEEITKTLNLKA